jgi:hypothetical protein
MIPLEATYDNRNPFCSNELTDEEIQDLQDAEGEDKYQSLKEDE